MLISNHIDIAVLTLKQFPISRFFSNNAVKYAFVPPPLMSSNWATVVSLWVSNDCSYQGLPFLVSFHSKVV